MDDAVLKLVDDVLANAPAALREACGILAGLETAGAFDVRTLRTLLEQDYAEVKQSISGAALPAFVARLKRPCSCSRRQLCPPRQVRSSSFMCSSVLVLLYLSPLSS